MTIRTGLAAQLGLGVESTWGTYATPTRFLEFVDESMTMDIERLISAGIRAGQRVTRSDRWAAGRRTIGGDLTLETQTTGIGLLLQHAFGGLSTVNPSAGVYEHTFTPGNLPVGLTVQLGRPSIDGTVRPFSYLGCRVTDFEITGEADEIGRLAVSLAGRDETTAQSLAAPTFPANDLLTFVEASITLGGAALPSRSFTLSGSNGLVVDRAVLGSQLAAEHLEGTGRTYSVEVDAHYVDLTHYNRLASGAEAQIVAKFEGGDITPGNPFLLQITANVRTDGSTPTVGGPDEIPLSLTLPVVDPGGNTGISVLYRTSDVTP